MSSSAAPQGDDSKSASRAKGGDDAASLRARITQLETELQRLHDAEHSARQREQHLAMHNLVLVNLSRSAAIEEGDLNAAFEQITVAAAHTLNVERASIWLFNEARTSIRCLDLYERSKDDHSEGLELKAADFPSYFRAVEDNRTLAADDARTDPRTREFDATYLSPLGITSMLDAPVRRGGKLIGVICHEHVGPPRSWSLEDQAFAGSMADFVALTLQAHERNRALEVLRASERQLRQIIDLMPHMILAKDSRGRILLANRAVADAYGLGADQLIGRNHWDVHPVRDEVAAMLSDDLRVIQTGEKHVVAEEKFTDVRGRSHMLQTTKIPFMFSASCEQAVLGVSIDITQRMREEHVRSLLLRELDHRVRNNLAVVTSIAEQTARESESIEEFTNAFIGRLRALALTHEMLASSGWEGADLRGLVQRLIEPFRSDHGRTRVVFDGEIITLPASIAPCMCMLLHELTTNAAKHGALSEDAGSVLLSWQREMRREGDHRAPWLHVEWTERGGPKVQPPKRTGFGTTFIQQAAASQLRGQSSLHFEPGGVRCVIEVPLEHACERSVP